MSQAASALDDETPEHDGASEVDRIVEESKRAIQKKKNPSAQDEEETKSASASAFSSYDTTDSKGKFKCKACL